MTDISQETKSRKFFSSMAEKASKAAGSQAAFVIATLLVLIWAMIGPLYDFSEEWLIFMHVIIGLITFFLVILMQNTQYRETRALQLKLDELIRATHGAHNMLLSVEKLTEKELDILWEQYKKLSREARHSLKQGISDQNVPHVALETQGAHGAEDTQ